MTKPTPNWQPISALPLLAKMTTEMLSDVEAQLDNLKPAQEQPHVLDDHTVGRLLKVYGEQQEFLWVYDEQVMRWQREALSTDQKEQLDQMEQQLAQLNQALTDILKIANALKGKTIESVLGKSDQEIAMDILSGKLKPPL